jgi:DNA-binding transcriptional MerR regulator
MPVRTSKKSAPAYTPADICERFDLNRTTLFRWEADGAIQNVERNSKGQRVYRDRHLKQIGGLLRKKVKTEAEAAQRYRSDAPMPAPDAAERLYRIRFASGIAPLTQLDSLKGVLLAHGLTKKTADFLIDQARKLPDGDRVRERIWQLLAQYEKRCRT